MRKRQLIGFIAVAALCCAFMCMLDGHEGHHHAEQEQNVDASLSLPLASSKDGEISSIPTPIFSIGKLHPLILHFPIALIVMTVISEGLYFVSRKPLYDHASRFMIIAAALTAVPTALSGLAFGYGVQYEGEMANFFWWHRLSGLSTMCLAVLAATLREAYSEKGWPTLNLYYACLGLVFITVSIAAFLGGTMAFG